MAIDHQTITDSLSSENQEKIRKIERQIEAQLEEISEHELYVKSSIRKIGQLLTQAKAILGREKKYQSWITERWGKSFYKTANHYRQIYLKLQPYENVFTYLPLDFLNLLSKGKLPREILDLIDSEAQFLHKSHLNKIEDAYKNFKRGKIDETQLLAVVNEQIEQGKIDDENGKQHQIRPRKELNHHKMEKDLNTIKNIIKGLRQYQFHDVDFWEARRMLDIVKDLSEKADDLGDKLGDTFFRKIEPEHRKIKMALRDSLAQRYSHRLLPVKPVSSKV